MQLKVAENFSLFLFCTILKHINYTKCEHDLPKCNLVNWNCRTLLSCQKNEKHASLPVSQQIAKTSLRCLTRQQPGVLLMSTTLSQSHLANRDQLQNFNSVIYRKILMLHWQINSLFLICLDLWQSSKVSSMFILGWQLHFNWLAKTRIQVCLECLCNSDCNFDFLQTFCELFSWLTAGSLLQAPMEDQSEIIDRCDRFCLSVFALVISPVSCFLLRFYEKAAIL